MNKSNIGDLIIENESCQYGLGLAAEEYDESKTRYLRISDIDDFGNLIDNDKKSVSANDIENYILKENELVVARTGNSTGRTYVYTSSDGKLAYAGFLIKYVFDESKINPRYMKYYTLSNAYKAQIKGFSGSTRGNMNAQDFKSVVVSYPDRYTQNKMVKLFDNITEKIKNNNRINSEFESLAKTIYDYWFLQFEFPNEEGKPYKSSGGKMVWNDELKREIPEGWETGNLYDIADFINGLACQKFRPLDDDHKLPVIKIGEMHDGFGPDVEWTRDDVPEKNIIENGDILFSWSATLETMIWNKGKGVLNQHIFKVIPKSYDKYYVFQQLSAYIVNFIQMAEARKTTMGHITTEHLRQSRIALPPLFVTKMFGNRVENIYSLLLNNSVQNQKLASLRDFLLPMLMNGQVTFKEK